MNEESRKGNVSSSAFLLGAILLNAKNLIILRFDCLFERIVRNVARQRHNCRAVQMADFRLLHAVKSLQRLFDARLAMTAHHTFDFQSLFHGFCLLFYLFCLFLVAFSVVPCIMHLEQIQPQRVCHDAEAGKAHGRSAVHGIQLPTEQMDEHARRQRDADHIV